MSSTSGKKSVGALERAESPTATNGDVRWLVVRGAAQNNLKTIDVGFPLGRFTCVTGVSGSGKSSLVNDILHRTLSRELNRASSLEPGRHDRIEGIEHLDKVIAIDQSPIGRTPRSNPATYIKVFDEIRGLFAKLPDAKLRGYKPGRFSFNVPMRRGGGRCEACEGNGSNRVEMDFLSDVWVTCPVCEGQRFGRETLQIRYKGQSVADVLNLEVQDALALFENIPRIRGMLETLHDVGLDYIQLGQPSPTLSGGEAQRIKLARELVKKPTGCTLYVLDEPTTGLHFDDIRKLLSVLHGFVDAGNTVVVIEHNLDVLKTADWVIDLGPEGGEAGGQIVVAGTPEEVAACAASYTGQALRVEFGGRENATDGAARAASVPNAQAVSDPTAISVMGARQHNLKGVSARIPRDEITVCTGVSGSGKTSFAIDTVFTEGYRRYVESLSAYARQFLGQMSKPRVDHVEGLSPAICIEQKSAGKSPRSTVGTVTEIYDYMRVLWARVGTRYCPECEEPVGSQTADEIVERVLRLEDRTPIMLLAPVSLGDGETYASLFNRLRSSGYTRVRIDGVVRLTSEATTLDARRKHRVEVVVDRTVVREKSRSRIAESVEHALALGGGLMTLLVEEVEKLHAEDADAATDEGASPAALRVEKQPAREVLYSQKLACLKCGRSFEEIGPNHFSFNSQLGWCETCEGLGVQRGAPAAALIRHPERTLFDGALAGWNHVKRRSPFGMLLAALCDHLGVSPEAPLLEWTEPQKRVLLFGSQRSAGFGGLSEAGEKWLATELFADLRVQWRGLFPTIDHATRNSWTLRHKLRNVVTDIPCVTCHGGRLRPEPAAVRLAVHAGEPGRTIVEMCHQPLREVAEWFAGFALAEREQKIAGEVLKEIRTRLQFLLDVGLHYLTLHRAAPTLSGGEAQRIRLASQLGSGLSGVLYVLDEPTIGLHPRDTGQLIAALQKLRNLGNTLLMVEHDRDVISSADGVLDFGPRAGSAGGEIVAEGPPAGLVAKRHGEAAADASLTQAYLNGELAIAVPMNRRPVKWNLGAVATDPVSVQERICDTNFTTGTPPALVIRGARQHNLRNVDVPIPLGRLVCVTGVSGSGKSSLVNDILWPALAVQLQRANLTVGDHRDLEGVDQIDKVVNVDQSPIGSTPSSNPATYTGVFDWIRELFARLPESKMRGYGANRFSFNRPGGRCEACEGYGQRCIEMHFMPDVWVECESCGGRRYNAETLGVKFKGKSIADVLELRVSDALALFVNVPKVKRMLQTLADVGLDYVPLGQPAPTLSGGEAQRVKLATELGKPDTGRTLYILDEPTTGLHFDDIRKLLAVMHRLVDLGNSLVVVEHNLDVLKCADWVIDLGPEAGAEGGQVVALGTPEDLAACAQHPDGAVRSHTGVALRPALEAGPQAERVAFDAAAHLEKELSVDQNRFGDVGKDVRMPWQIDGRAWHLEQRRSRSEEPTRWEPDALEYVLEQVHKAGRGRFGDTNWNNRASVEVTTPGAKSWFLHALTGGEWLLELYFMVPRGTFNWRALDEELGLLTLDERDDLLTYGDWARVDVRPRRGGLDATVVYVHDKKEIDTPAFRRFLRTAVRAYLDAMDQAAGTQGRKRRKSTKRARKSTGG